MNTLDKTFDPQTLADDLLEVRGIYVEFFANLNESDWDKPVKGGSKEWRMHETIAHLCALNGDGLESIKNALRGEPFTFVGLETRYQLNSFNRKGIDDHLSIPMKALWAEHLGILEEAASIARNLTPEQAMTTVTMSIYNRPVRILEGLSIINFHAGVIHMAQVAEPAGVAPLWTHLSPDARHRLIGRTVRAFSLLYRIDIGGQLRETIVFRVDGAGGGEWYLKLAPDAPASGEGVVEKPGLVIYMRETAVFYRMLTSHLNLPLALLKGDMKLRGNLRLFFRMDELFSVDKRPRNTTPEQTPAPPHGRMRRLPR